MTSKTFTITARQFRDLVAPVLPLALKGRGEPPTLTAVHLRSVGKYLVATATDRFVMGFQRTTLPEPLDGLDAIISTAAVRSILAIFKPSRQADPELEFAFEAESLTVRSLGIDLGEATISGEVTYPLVLGKYPDVPKVVRAALANEPSAEPVAVNPAFLAKFAAAQTLGEPMVIIAHGEGKPVVVRVGENFVGLIQPVRFESRGPRMDDRWTEIFAEAPAAKTTKKKAA